MRVWGFDWDDGNWPKCAKHGVAKNEIEYALSHTPRVLPDRNSPAEEVRWNAVGLTEGGRHLFIVFTIRVRERRQLIRPISARFMHDKEIRRYESR